MQLEKMSSSNISIPHIGLRHCISFYNMVVPEKNMFSDQYTIVPDINGTIAVFYDGNKMVAEVWGTSTQSYIIGEEPNHFRQLLLIELSPTGLYRLTGFNQSEFTNKRIDLALISPSLSLCLCNAFEKANTISDLIQLLDKILLDYIGTHELKSEFIIVSNKIKSSFGLTSVRELAQLAHYSERHLNRMFLMYAGVNIKTFSRLIRFNQTIRMLHKTSGSFSELSEQCGFYDQSHFIKDFKAICGVTPEIYVKNMSDFSYTQDNV